MPSVGWPACPDAPRADQGAVRDVTALRPGRPPAETGNNPDPADQREGEAMSEADRLEAAISECREMIREAHAATKDLRAAVREAKQEVRVLATDEVAAHIQAEVSRQLRSWA